MGLLKVAWTNTALSQRNQNFEYWNERNKSKSFSKKLNSRIKDRILQVKEFPQIGVKTNFLDYRIITLGDFNIVYKIKEATIIISAF